MCRPAVALLTAVSYNRRFDRVFCCNLLSRTQQPLDWFRLNLRCSPDFVSCRIILISSQCWCFVDAIETRKAKTGIFLAAMTDSVIYFSALFRKGCRCRTSDDKNMFSLVSADEIISLLYSWPFPVKMSRFSDYLLLSCDVIYAESKCGLSSRRTTSLLTSIKSVVEIHLLTIQKIGRNQLLCD